MTEPADGTVSLVSPPLQRMRGRPGATAAALAGLVVATLLSGCVFLGVTDDRGPVSLAEFGVTVAGGTILYITVPSCGGDPELASLEQTPESITVEVVTTVHDSGPACAESIRIDLDEPLGDRDVIDAVSGETLALQPAIVDR